ncbi:MAG: hypothetical protein RSG59_07560 [Ruthenibacterium sp.]
MSNERAKIDDILDQVHSRTPAGPANDAIDEDVNAILVSLGMPAKPAKRSVLAPEKPAAAPQTAQSAPPQTAAQQPAPPKHTAGAHIVNMAPLAAPVVQNETETLELPSIKAYSQMQSRRIAEIERAAAETALARAAERQKQSGYTVPGMAPRAEVLSVEVDDRFRAFFGKTVANDGTAPRAEDTAELETPRSRRKASRRKGSRLKSVLEKAGQDPDEIFLSGEFDAPLQHDNVNAALRDTPEAQSGDALPQLLAMTGNFDVLGTSAAPPAAAPYAQNPVPGKADFTASITPTPSPSDTFMLNHIDARAEEGYEDAAAGQSGTQYYGGDAFEDYDAAGGDYFGEVPAPPSGSTFREITVTMPIGKTTSTIGIDPDKYGVPNADYEEYSDYNHLSDGPDILHALRNMRITRILRICITGAIALFLVYLGITARSALLPAIGALSAKTQPMMFLIANLALLCVAALICMTAMGAGLAGLFGHPSADSLTALAVLGATVQSAAYLLNPKSYDPAAVTLFAPVAVLLLCFNTVGKWLHSKAVSDSFAIAGAGEDHAAAFLVPNRELTKMVCAGLGEPDPLLLVSRPTELVRGFMRQSFSSHLSDVYGRKLSLILLFGGVLCGVVTGLRSGETLLGLSAAAAALCLGAPLTATLVYAVPACLLQRAAGQAGAVVPGPSAVQNLGLCNTVLLSSNDLFPATSVRLNGIKPFEKQRIDLAILYAASLVYENCDTLRDTFMALIDGKRKMLYKVGEPQIETGYGFSGRVDGHDTVFGNRAMMHRHNVEIPSGDYERKFTKNGERSVMYLAVDGRPYCLYVISYLADPAAQDALDSLAESGISVLIQSDDFNLTAQLVASTYHVSPALVKVLSQPEREMLAGQTDYLPESEGYMTHRGTCASFIGGLRAAATAARREHLADTIEMAAVLFTILIALVLSGFLALSELSLPVVLLYQLAWCAITLLPAIFKK